MPSALDHLQQIRRGEFPPPPVAQLIGSRGSTGLGPTLPPSALDISWPPRQWPITGTSFRPGKRII